MICKTLAFAPFVDLPRRQLSRQLRIRLAMAIGAFGSIARGILAICARVALAPATLLGPWAGATSAFTLRRRADSAAASDLLKAVAILLH